MIKRYPGWQGSLIAAFSCMLAACSFSLHDTNNYHASARVHRVIQASGVQNVRVVNVSGDVIVVGSNRSDVEVNAVVRAPDKGALQKISVLVDRTGDSIRVQTKYPTVFFSFGGDSLGRVDYVIHVPRSVAVSTANVDGGVKVSGVDGDVTAASVSGDVEASTIHGNLNLKTTSGTIVGSARTVSPGIQLSAGSVSGDVSLRIPRSSAANIGAHSVSGDFSSNLGMPKPNGTVGTSLNATLNGGGAKITLSTVSGAMTLTGF